MIKGWYDRHVMPRLVTCACSQDAIADRRAEIVPLASGRVFELGCGGGLNQPLYDREAVTLFAGIDPHEGLLRAARKRAAEIGWEHDLRQASGEDIPFADGSFDTVVCTYTLCSVDNPSRVISELSRILKPGGRLLFLEHGRAPDPAVYKWQKRIEPIWKPMAGGCHLTRPVGGSLRAAGLEVEPLGQMYLTQTPRPLGWMEWGIARKRGA
ncbi:class I SAM-dependent methyltransferase [Qipengyuania sp.]|uniref:class I SAM-dependent methyltransferase n=1 Tax=Qipengyuania sp. TaxID=2004515 RepID=UPI0035C7B6C9